MKPTPVAYKELQEAYDYFNRELFDSSLPDCLLTLQRKGKRVLGYFSPSRFEGEGEMKADELAMNPIHFHASGTKNVLATLVHEQCHVWQQHFGKPGRGKYHNRQWADKMKTVGLHPSKTGAEGGKETGDQVHHYILKGQKFERACDALLKKGFRLTWAESGGEPLAEGEGEPEKEKPKDKSNRLKYSCPDCGQNAWGKPKLLLLCGKCRKELVRAKKGKNDDE